MEKEGHGNKIDATIFSHQQAIFPHQQYHSTCSDIRGSLPQAHWRRVVCACGDFPFDPVMGFPHRVSRYANPAPVDLGYFGGIWGFWGVFFAIPLATLVKAVMNAWDEDDPVEIE